MKERVNVVKTHCTKFSKISFKYICQLYKALGGIIKAIYKEKSSQKRWGAEGCATVPTSMHWSSNPREKGGTGTV